MAVAAFDVIVIGSGAGGAAAAWRLCTSGVRVLLLEAGPRFTPEVDYALHTPRWEQRRFPYRPWSKGQYRYGVGQALDPRLAELRSWNHISGAMAPGDTRHAWGYHHVRGVGGSTLAYTGEAQRLNPRSMRMRSEHGVAANWPLDYAQLEPYYTLAERIIGVAGAHPDPRCPRSAPFPVPAHGPSYASQHLLRGFEALGLGWQPNTLAALSQPYDQRPGCNYCGNCNRGCPRGDKGSADVTFVAKALATGNLELRTHSAVLRLVAGDDDRVSAVEVAGVDGKRERLRASRVVVACGAIESPRLLLASSGRHAPDGLGNESGLVGRNLMETVYWVSSGLHPQRVDAHRGLPTDVVSWDYNAPDAIPGVPGGCRFSPATAEMDLIGPINHAQRIVGGWGRKHHARMRETFGHVLSVGSLGESLPNPHAYVDLHPHDTDADGVPLARIHAHLGEHDVRRLQFMARMTREILAAAGASERVEELSAYDAFNATHVFGTCRMGEDPQQAVVNAEGRSHRWRNLYVCDASVFPSSGGGEGPSLTVSALAIRSADAMLKQAV